MDWFVDFKGNPPEEKSKDFMHRDSGRTGLKPAVKNCPIKVAPLKYYESSVGDENRRRSLHACRINCLRLGSAAISEERIKTRRELR